MRRTRGNAESVEAGRMGGLPSHMLQNPHSSCVTHIPGQEDTWRGKALLTDELLVSDEKFGPAMPAAISFRRLISASCARGRKLESGLVQLCHGPDPRRREWSPRCYHRYLYRARRNTIPPSSLIILPAKSAQRHAVLTHESQAKRQVLRHGCSWAGLWYR